MATMNYSDPEKAFETAILMGFLSDDESAANFVGNVMYMGALLMAHEALGAHKGYHQGTTATKIRAALAKAGVI